MRLPALRPASVVPLLLALVGALVVGQHLDANAASDTTHDVLVSEDPVDWTPQFTGDRVRAIDTASGVVAAGGAISAAKTPGGSDQPYQNLVLFEQDSGALLPAPSFDREVYAVEAAADGQSFYVAGRFNNVNGSSRSGIARVGLDGTVIESFRGRVDWAVYDLTLVGDVLYLGGNFNEASGEPREGLAALDAETGDALPWAPDVADARSTDRTNGHRSIDKIDTSADGSRMVVIGNFSTIDGQTRDQVAMFDLAGGTPVLADWYAEGFAPQCRASIWPMWIRDMDVAPDGSHVVFGTTGAYGSPTSDQKLCDTTSRFELTETGVVEPTWRSYSGGDTFYGVATTGDVVYAGGHMRWMNNPYRGDQEGPGAVDRVGIAALDARTGVPLDWTSTRDPRGYGTYELIADDTGLWVGQDTGFIGGEYHSLIAKLPTAGGRAVPRPAAGDPASGVMLLDTSTTVELAATAGGGLLGSTTSVSFDPDDIGAATAVGNDLLLARSDGSFQLVAEGGSGATSTLDLNGLESGGYFDVEDLTSLFFDELTSRLYYTQDGSTTLRARGYSSDSRIVEALEFPVSTSGDGFDWWDVTGAWLDGSTLYVGRGDGTLDAIDWVDGAPVAGTLRTVGGPDADGVDYAVNALTAVGTSAEAPNQAPVAALEVDCSGLECTVDAADSSDSDGSVTGYQITLNGEVVATASTATVTVPGEGTHEFAVTVTDDDGATDSASTTVDVSADPTAGFDTSCDGLTCSFDGTASTDGSTPGDGIVSHAWELGDGTTADTATVEHTYDAAGTYTVTLTVTDDEGATGTTSQELEVLEPLEGVGFLAASGDNRWTSTPTATVPDDVRDGSFALLQLTVNADGNAPNPPEGAGSWTELDRAVSDNSETVVWHGQLDAADAGAEVRVPLTRGRKIDISLLVYGNVDLTDPVLAHGAAAETSDTSEHVTPTVETTSGSFVVSLWADKTRDSTSWTAPSGQLVRHESHGDGGGRIGFLATDADALSAAGTLGGLTATSGAADDSATMWTIALRPAG